LEQQITDVINAIAETKLSLPNRVVEELAAAQPAVRGAVAAVVAAVAIHVAVPSIRNAVTM
jgi:hypothetical protein